MTDSNATAPRVLIVGSGHGLRVHLPALRAAGFEVVGLVGRDIDRARQLAGSHGIAAGFDDLETAIDATGARAVTIASPPHTHGELVLTAAVRGCHILCEKPFAADAGEARTLLEAAERAGVVHLIGNQMRANPERIVAARAIADGLIGEPRFYTHVQHVNLVADPTAKRPEWWFDPAAGGGWLGASGSHQIDMIRSWLGEFHSLSAATPMVSDRSGVAEDSFDVRFTLASGLEGVISQSGGCWGPTAMMSRLMGTRGTLWLEGGQAWLADHHGTRALEIPGPLQLPHIPPSDDPRKPYLHLELPPSIRMCEAWRDAITRRTPLHGYATFADGLACMKVIDAVRQSATNGGQLVTLT